MAISFVGQASGTNTATIPAHVAGDLIIVIAYNTASTSSPSTPTGFLSIATAGNTTTGGRYSRKIATSSSETISTMTDCTSCIVLVYRGTHPTSPIGGSTAWSSSGGSPNIEYRSVTFAGSSGSWVLGVSLVKSTTTAAENPPSGMVLRRNLVSSGGEVSVFDTNGAVTSWPNTTVNLGAAFPEYNSRTFEIREKPPAILVADGGSIATTGADAGLIRRRLFAEPRTISVTGAPVEIKLDVNWFPMKVRKSGSWVPGKLKIFDGTNWVKPKIKRRVGGAWVDA